MEKTVSEDLLEKAYNAHSAEGALHFTQAAMNAAHVRCIEAQADHMAAELEAMNKSGN